MLNQISFRQVKETHIPVFTLADRLKKTRAGTGLSIADFAKFSRLSPRQIQYAESGVVVAKDVIITVYAAKTGVDYEWLRTGNIPEQAQIQIAEMESLLGLDSNQEPIGSCLLPNFRPKTERFSSYLSFQRRQHSRFGGGHAFINRFA
jgi:transcriptional regulator with XRE-family HTH domain